MAVSRVLRHSLRSTTSVPRLNSTVLNKFKPINTVRPLTSSTKLYKEDKNTAPPGSGGDRDHEGSFARTDREVRVEYPEEADLPRSKPVQGRGGMHFKRTLASFSLDGRVGIVTGGARGLGLVMSQAMVVSGADVAIVDLNSKQSSGTLSVPDVLNANLFPSTEEEGERQAKALMKHFREENPGSEQ